MFDIFSWWSGLLHDPSIGAVGDPFNRCAPPVMDNCSRVDMVHQGQIVVPKNDLFDGHAVKTLQPVHFGGHTKPQFLQPVGPSVMTNESTRGKIFSFTAQVEPDTAIVNGLQINWTAPPDASRILISPSDHGPMHEATGWIPTKAAGRFAGGIPQSQNIVFSNPENLKRVEIQMRDLPSSFKTQFGIDQVSLITNPKDFLSLQ